MLEHVLGMARAPAPLRGCQATGHPYLWLAARHGWGPAPGAVGGPHRRPQALAASIILSVTAMKGLAPLQLCCSPQRITRPALCAAAAACLPTAARKVLRRSTPGEAGSGGR